LPGILDRLPEAYVLYYTSGLFRGSMKDRRTRAWFRSGAPDRDGLVAAYQSCDMLLAPSRLEGFGIAQAEALACGRPVVTTRISALPEVVDHDRSGFLCPRDDVDAYADAVRRLGRMKRCDDDLASMGARKLCAASGLSNWGAVFWNSMIACCAKTEP